VHLNIKHLTQRAPRAIACQDDVSANSMAGIIIVDVERHVLCAVAHRHNFGTEQNLNVLKALQALQQRVFEGWLVHKVSFAEAILSASGLHLRQDPTIIVKENWPFSFDR
jgi:hypothetical protein